MAGLDIFSTIIKKGQCNIMTNYDSERYYFVVSFGDDSEIFEIFLTEYEKLTLDLVFSIINFRMEKNGIEGSIKDLELVED